MSELIDRQQAIDALRKMQTYKLFSGDDMLLIDQAGAMTELMLLPSAEPQERTGYWIYDGFDHPHGIEWCHCSVCGNCEDMKSVYTNVHVYPYCAKCGARMDSEQILSETDNDTAYGGLMSAT